MLDEHRASQHVPGISAIVVRHSETVFAGASGFADLESGAAMSVDSVLYIGSVSKVLTAVLVLQLVDEERLSLTDAAAAVGQRRADSKPPITIAHLLTHTSGLEREGDFGYWFTADFPDDAALLRYLESQEPRGPPGTSLHYSNIGYALLGRIVQDATGTSYSEALGKRVLRPLEMRASGGRGPAVSPAMGYTPVDRLLPSEARPFAGVGKRVGRRHERSYHDARAMSPAFGAYSTASDMGRLAGFLLGAGSEGVLSETLRTGMLTPHASGWGLGLKIRQLDGRTVARHDGWFAAHRSHLLLDIENGIGVVVLANSDNAEPGEIAEALLDAALSSCCDRRQSRRTGGWHADPAELHRARDAQPAPRFSGN